MRFTLSLIFICTTFLFGQQLNDPKKTTGNDSTDIQLFNLGTWHVTEHGIQKQVTLPYYSSAADTLVFERNFHLQQDTLVHDLLFSSNGIKGYVQLFINKQLVGSNINNSAPFSLTIPHQLLLAGRKNEIKLVLSRNRNISGGFLTFSHMYTEPEVIGITRLLKITAKQVETRTDFSYSLTQSGQQIKAEYDYIFSPPKPFSFKGITFHEAFTDSSGRILLSRALKGAGAAITVSGKLNLPQTLLWGPKNRQFITHTLTLKRYGQPIFSQSYKVGFRHIAMQNGIMMLNFKKIDIKGVLYYENVLNLAAGTNELQRIIKQLNQIKESGFNAIRFRNHIPDTQFYKVADTLGLLLFSELPIKNYPTEIFTQDIFLENVKSTLKNTLQQLQNHPSFFAIGLGQNIVLTNPLVQKYFIILKQNLHTPIPFLTYLSPNLAHVDSGPMVSDFYMVECNHFNCAYQQKALQNSNSWKLLGKIGYAPFTHTGDVELNKITRRNKLLADLSLLSSNTNLQGAFIESYNDWTTRALFYESSNKENIVQSGMIDSTGQLRSWSQDFITTVWDKQENLTLEKSSIKHPTNTFTIFMLFTSLLFFFFYRRYPRLSENYKRSLRHPYGFFVDMRERRIIPIFNSLAVGIHNAFIKGVFIASFFYYFNFSYAAQEIFSVLIGQTAIYPAYQLISNNPILLILFFFCLLYLITTLLGLFIKTIGLFARRQLRLRQAMAIGMWSGSPYIFMLPFTLFAYHLILDGIYIYPLLIVFIIFQVWIKFRLINGIRVLLNISFLKVFLALTLLYIIPLLVIYFFFNPQPMWLNYIAEIINLYV